MTSREEHCPHCSFNPTSSNDYCDEHRAARSATPAAVGGGERDAAWVKRLSPFALFDQEGLVGPGQPFTWESLARIAIDLLCSSPPPREGNLTDAQIDAIFSKLHNTQESPWVNWRRFAREILATQQAPKTLRMLTEEETHDAILSSLDDTCVENIQRKFCEVNADALKAAGFVLGEEGNG